MTAVSARGLEKRFRGSDRPRTWKDLLVRRRRLADVEALRGVDLEIEEGAAVGIVGSNGAGKSTLLRVLSGVLEPDAGTFEVKGRVGSLLELGAGFHPDMTGRESAVLAALIDGRSRRDAKAQVTSVTEFAGLTDFIDRPLRTYSTGMTARLAFAIATEVQREVLFVDEVLAVGDVAFQRQCIERLTRFRDTGTTILVVSHEPDLLRLLCDRGIWLDAGAIVHDGPVDQVLASYTDGARPSAAPAEVLADRLLRQVRLADDHGRPCEVLNSGAPLVVSVSVASTDEPAQVSVRIVRDDGLVCVDTSTPIPGDQTDVVLRLERLDLAPGQYDVEVAMYDPSWRTLLDHERATLRVLGTASAQAALAPPARWRVGEPHGDDRQAHRR